MSEHQNDDRFVRMREQAEELIRQGQANFAPESYPFRGYRMLSYNPSLRGVFDEAISRNNVL